MTRTWLRFLVGTVTGKVPGKTSRPDTATRMALHADFGYRRESTSSRLDPSRERDDGHLVKPVEELIRIVNEAQERDAEDERRLYDPMLRDRGRKFSRKGHGAWAPWLRQ